jgi:hypothetical protein
MRHIPTNSAALYDHVTLAIGYHAISSSLGDTSLRSYRLCFRVWSSTSSSTSKMDAQVVFATDDDKGSRAEHTDVEQAGRTRLAFKHGSRSGF